MADLKKAVIKERSADGKFLISLPGAAARLVRRMAQKSRSVRQQRAMRTAQRVFPVLKAMEHAAMPEDDLLIADMTFAQASKDPKAIERCLKLFRLAWERGLIEIQAGTGKARKPIQPKDADKAVGVCGMSVKAVETLFLYRAARLIMRGHPKVQLNQRGLITGPEALPRLRVLSRFDTEALAKLYTGLGADFRKLFEVDSEMVAALSRLKPFHIDGLMTAMGGNFKKIMDAPTETVAAIADGFTYPEQLEDLGQEFLLLDTAEEVRALAAWEVREKIDDNGNPVVVTDIGTARKMLGGEFGVVMEQKAPMIEAMGRMIQKLRAVEDKRDRLGRIETLKSFIKRYLPYMSGPSIEAMHIGDGDATTITFTEAHSILEGIWNKEGIGKKFFDNLMEDPDGAKKLGAVVESYLDMKKRGSIKEGTDVGSMIRNSDIFDEPLGLN